MLLRNKKNGFGPSVWPVDITWQPGGVAYYSMAEEVATLWKAVGSAAPPAEPVTPADEQVPSGG